MPGSRSRLTALAAGTALSIACVPPALAALLPFGGARGGAAEPGAYHVKGFRGADFGMTRAEVLADIEREFMIPADRVKTSVNPAERTTVLTITVDKLEPGPGPATIAYVLGATSHKLMRIGISWVAPGNPGADARAALVNAAEALATEFRRQVWAEGGARAASPLGPNGLALFVGRDPAGSAVEIDVQGVSYTQQQNGQTVASPPPSGPAALSLTYTQDAAHPDIYRLPKGSF